MPHGKAKVVLLLGIWKGPTFQATPDVVKNYEKLSDVAGFFGSIWVEISLEPAEDLGKRMHNDFATTRCVSEFGLIAGWWFST